MMATGLTLMVVAAAIEPERYRDLEFLGRPDVAGRRLEFRLRSAPPRWSPSATIRTERNKVQAFNDFLVFGSMALGSFASGALLAHYGWTAVNDMVFPVILVAAALLTWGSLAQRPKAA